MQCYVSGVKGRLSMNEKYEKLFCFIVDTDKECSAELLHALKSLRASFDNALGQFTRNYTQTTKRGLLTTNKG